MCLFANYEIKFIELFMEIFMKKILITIIALGILSSFNLNAEIIDTNKIKSFVSSDVNIITDKSQTIKTIPGSAAIISQNQITNLRVINGNQVLRTISGTNLVDEEGLGLRMNLGIRGLDPDRSRSILVLEDGIPVALAPYGEPEMYYTPSIDRMKSVELLKGSGSIIHGPQTIGGVMNYITNDPPYSEQINMKLCGGNDGYLNSKISYGNSFGNNGFIAELYHKRADKVGLTKFSTFDFLTKTKIAISKNSVIKIKTGVYDETSNSTYLGITQNMFDNGEYYADMVPNDELAIKRYSFSAAYQSILNLSSIMNISVFGNQTSRDWRRQDFDRKSSTSNKTGEVYGDTSIANGAIYLKNSNANRDREFNVLGSQIDLNSNFEVLGFENQISTGVRFLYEKALEQRINGTTYLAVSGNLVEDEIRTGNALSVFAQDKIYLSKDFLLTLGLRFEMFDYERDIRRIKSRDTMIFAEHGISELIPGIGINYSFHDNITIFAGMHRGFAPPRTKDAITAEGTALDLSAELSWNYEIGIRPVLSNYLSGELTFYALDFSNQIIPVSVSSGGLGFGLINGGRTLHTGLEISFLLNIGEIIDYKNEFSLSFSSTIGNSEYSSDRIFESGSEKININGNKLPYAPEFSASTVLNFKFSKEFGFTFNSTYVGEQFTDELNTVSPSADGTIGLIDSYMLFDFSMSYEISNNIEIFASVKNISDSRFIASRRPQGIKVSVPRMLTAGIDYRF